MSQLRDQMINALIAHARGDIEKYRANVETSEHYVNCKPVTLGGEGLTLVGSLFLEEVEEDSQAVAGLTLGADPLVCATAMTSWLDFERRTKLAALIVRKEAKGHGTQAWIEGPLPIVGAKVTVLEDVITTGGSALKAVEKLRDVGFRVERVVAILDRQEGGYENITTHGLELRSLFTLGEL